MTLVNLDVLVFPEPPETEVPLENPVETDNPALTPSEEPLVNPEEMDYPVPLDFPDSLVSRDPSILSRIQVPLVVPNIHTKNLKRLRESCVIIIIDSTRSRRREGRGW